MRVDGVVGWLVSLSSLCPYAHLLLGDKPIRESKQLTAVMMD